MKRTLYLLSLLTLAACSNDDNAVPETNVDRTEITFSSNLSTEVSSQPMTRALSEDGFEQQTRIVMRIKSEDNPTSPTSTKYTRTKALAAEKSDGKSAVTFESGDKRYWDDAHGRNSCLSVYAVAIENQNLSDKLPETVLSEGTPKVNNWTDVPSDLTLSWTLTQSQSTDIIAQENLVYSNNIQNNGTDERLKFQDNGTGHGTFDRGELKFNHALTRITVKLQTGDGFTSFTNVTGVVKNAPYKGKLDLTDGTWASVNSQDITMAQTNETNTYQAQILPGLELTDGSTNNILEFTIDNNVYYVTSDMLYDKLNGLTSTGGSAALDGGKLRPGMNYAINLKVQKTGVQVSAKVVGWDTVTINETLSNNYIQLSFHNFGGTACDKEKIKLYYCTQNIGTPSISDPGNLFSWDQTYTGPVDLADTDESNVYKATNLYFESNTIFYHFRTTTESSLASGAKTFSISSGFTETDAKDPHWGAPIKGSEKPKYNPLDAEASEKGFGKYIHSAIGSTSSTIAITEFHMLSNVIIKLTTPSDGSGVTLNNATVKLLKIAEEGTVDMGSGFITPSAIQDTYEVPVKSGGTNEYFSPIVPQALKRSDASTVGVEITTTDGNVYKLDDISTFTAKTVSEGAANHTLNGAVDRWYPNTEYTYTFKLKKTGIDQITCTVTEWDKVEVEGGEITIQ